MIIIAVSLGLGLGIAFVPEVISQTPPLVQQIFGSGVTTGGMTAILLNMLLPKGK
jgi:xanthine permease XanP